MNDELSSTFEWTLPDETTRLEAIASAIDALPGETGFGVTQLERIQIHALLEFGTAMHWFVAQQVRVAGTLTLGKAIAAHHRVSVAMIPAESQILATLRLLSATRSTRARQLLQ